MRPVLAVLISAGLAVLLLAGGLVWWLSSGEECERTETVAVRVTPELADLATDVLAGTTQLGDGACARADVVAQRPLQTVADLGALDADALPDVWVPDSSLWAARAGEAPLEKSGSVASSPVVLATSEAVVAELGWADQAPSWAEALTADRALAVPDLAASTEGLSALAAARMALGGGPEADNAVVQAVLAAARAGAPSAADALVPVSEQEVFQTNEGSQDPPLTAVYPSEGSPVLDYPVLRVGAPTGAQRSAVDAVVRLLTSGKARSGALKAGFRGADGTAPAGAGQGTGIREQAPEPLALDPDDLRGLLQRLSSLATPSRLLAVFDVSTSMRADVGDGTRATLARDAAKSALTLFPDNSAIGLWVFARQLSGDADWTELIPTRSLDADVNGRSQRDALREQLDTMPDRLSPGGTGLYDTALAAVRAARADFDPTAVSSVVIITDGKDEDEDSIGLDRLVATLAEESDETRPVKVIGIALGPDADLEALRRIGEATGGAAYSAVDPNDLQTVLFDALRQRQ